MQGESVALMPDERPQPVSIERVRRLAEVFTSTDLLRLRIERGEEVIELGRQPRTPAPPERAASTSTIDVPSQRLEVIKADLVGIFRLSRPAVAEGDVLELDRELGYIEALGIRHPVRSLGSGRIAAVKRHDGEPVEYGQPLFEIDRG